LTPETPDERIEQDPGIPGHRTLDEQIEEPDLRREEPSPEDQRGNPDFDDEGHRAD
jgi:hypothetical protein